MNTHESTTIEIARKYGVVTLETARELDWCESTIFSWVKLGLEYSLYELQPTSSVPSLQYEAYLKHWVIDVIPAPQMHEIAPLLPTTWTLDSWASQLHWENSQGDEPVFLEYIKNNHFAEIFGRLYLKLKQAGLLEKEVRND